MSLKIYNSLTRSTEEFHPLKEGEIGMYVCGPTVYDVAHVGHARAAVAFDVIRRYLMAKKNADGTPMYKVKFVSNITDVDDKIINRAAQEGISEKELVERVIPEYQHDFDALRVLRPDVQPRATEFIPQMVEMVQSLMQKGVAYEIPGDGVYFRVRSFKEYGKLSGKKLDELQAGARVEVDRNKEDPADFVLWKGAKKGEPSWTGPTREDGTTIDGRPGWHIECSAMSKTLLGDTFDIHGGGIDLIFPHHECEIAQSETVNSGKKFANLWMHNGHVQINKEKMSKSLGNFFTVKEILAKYNPLVVRYFLLSTHYRNPIEFSEALLDQAKNNLKRIHEFYRRVKNAPVSDSRQTLDDFGSLKEQRESFEVAMDNDFEISSALGSLHGMMTYINFELDKTRTISTKLKNDILDNMNEFDKVLAILPHPKDDNLNNKDIENLIEERNQARASKNFKRSDEIREELKTRGIELDDTKSGTIWKRSL